MCMDLSTTPFPDLPDVTLADEDNNSIPTDDTNRAILCDLAMQVAPQFAKQSMVCYAPGNLTPRIPNSCCSPTAAARPSQKASHGVITGTKRGIIDLLVSKRQEKNSE